VAASFALALPVLFACGKAQRPPSAQPVASASASPSASAAPLADAGAPATAESPAFITYVTVDASWVESVLVPTPAVAKAWATDPANAALLLPTVRHILIKADKDSPAKLAAARTKALGIMARLKRGEDFAKVANDVSEDPGSNKKGGAYPGTFVAMFIDEFRAAYAALAPGETTKQPVKSQFGWHIIKKDLLDDEAVATSYKRANALPLARRLAGDVAEHLRPPHAEAAASREVDAAITALLGASAATDAHRPEVRLVPVDKVVSPPPGRICEKLVATPRESTVIITSEHDEGYIVSKAGPESQTDPSARSTAAIDAPDAPWSYCRPERAGAKLTAEQIREMIEKAQKRRK
jgi:hypothetical protein